MLAHVCAVETPKRPAKATKAVFIIAEGRRE